MTEEYLSTAELAKCLKLNQKKVYAMVAAGQLPAVRISGKWLFPRKLVERWLEEQTIHPPAGVLGSLLDRMLILQGSDDWLLSRVIEQVQMQTAAPIPTAAVGSITGLQALAQGRAHLASWHIEPAEVPKHVGGPAFLLELTEREQGLIFDAERTPRLDSLRTASQRKLRFATRQSQSGTARLVQKWLREAQLEPEWTEVGPFSSHLEVALAVRNGQADVGVGIHIASQLTGLAFNPFARERFSLAIPSSFFSHPRVARFLELLFEGIRTECARGLPGYSADGLGRLSPVAT